MALGEAEGYSRYTRLSVSTLNSKARRGGSFYATTIQCSNQTQCALQISYAMSYNYILPSITLHPTKITFHAHAHATLPITSAATPSSSLLTSIFIVTPVFALNAIRTIAATLPLVIVLP